MSRELATTLMILLGVLALGLMIWGWRRRGRRDAGLVAPLTVVDAPEHAAFDGFYVSTTVHDQPLNRLAVKHLAFRARARIAVTGAGVRLDIPGEPPVFIGAERIVKVARATVTIDRVVEKDGLVYLTWRIADDVLADSYLRLQNSPPEDLVAAIEGILPATTSTGIDA